MKIKKSIYIDISPKVDPYQVCLNWVAPFIFMELWVILYNIWPFLKKYSTKQL